MCKDYMSRLYLLILLGVSFTVQSQHPVFIDGHVQDSSSGEALIGSNIYAPAFHTGTSTNAYGYFSLSLPLPQKDSVHLLISHIGYITQDTMLTEFEQPLRINLLRQKRQLEEVVIPGKKNIIHRTEGSLIHMNMEEIKTLPSLTGEADVMQATRLMPGVSTGSEGKSSLFVRGGMPDQNLVMLDEVPLYYISHFGGFISIFNSDAVKSFNLWKGGFPARFGGRLSSVIDIRMKEGNMQNYQGKGSIGLLSAKAAYEGPIFKNKASFILSARRRTLPFLRITGTGLRYNFYDLNGKMNYAPNNKNKLYLSFYAGMDKIDNVPDKETSNVYNNQVDWGNMLYSIRWNHIFNNRLFSNFTLAYTRYNYSNQKQLTIKTDSTTKITDNKFSSGINDIHTKLDFTHQISSQFTMRFGLQAIYHSFLPNKISYYESRNHTTVLDTVYNHFNRKTLENSIYVTGKWEKDWFNFSAGLRFSYYYTKGLPDKSLEPRLTTNFILNPTLSIKLSYTQMKQYVHLLSYSGVGVPSDYWLPSTKNAPPETARQFSLSVAKTFMEGKIETSLESYYKKMYDLIAFKQGASFMNSIEKWEMLTETNGVGISRGIELLIRKKQGVWQGWFSVTHAKSIREFDNLNHGKSYPFKYDRPWDVTWVMNYQLSDNRSLSASWQYGTGTPISMPLEKYQTEKGDLVYVYSGKNNFRMRDYHRLDLAAHFSKKNRWGKRTISISLMNVYNRQNPYYYFFRKEVNGSPTLPTSSISTSDNQDIKLYQQSLVSFFPSISYRFEF